MKPIGREGHDFSRAGLAIGKGALAPEVRFHPFPSAAKAGVFWDAFRHGLSRALPGRAPNTSRLRPVRAFFSKRINYDDDIMLSLSRLLRLFVARGPQRTVLVRRQP